MKIGNLVILPVPNKREMLALVLFFLFMLSPFILMIPLLIFKFKEVGTKSLEYLTGMVFDFFNYFL